MIYTVHSGEKKTLDSLCVIHTLHIITCSPFCLFSLISVGLFAAPGPVGLREGWLILL